MFSGMKFTYSLCLVSLFGRIVVSTYRYMDFSSVAQEYDFSTGEMTFGGIHGVVIATVFTHSVTKRLTEIVYVQRYSNHYFGFRRKVLHVLFLHPLPPFSSL
jgi:hypothetical protein